MRWNQKKQKRKELIPVRDANVSISKTAMNVAGTLVITKNQQKVVVSVNMAMWTYIGVISENNVKNIWRIKTLILYLRYEKT